VIYVMLENRSFDNLFGRFPGANGATTGLKFGEEVPLIPAPHWLPGDLPHDRAAHLNDGQPKDVQPLCDCRSFTRPRELTVVDRSSGRPRPRA
jgi:hypothetical protein